MNKLIIFTICCVASGCASLFGGVQTSKLKEPPKQEFFLSNDYKKITIKTVFGKIIEGDSVFCKGRYTSIYADSEGVYYLMPVECGADFTGGIWVSNDSSYRYLHYWFIPKKTEISSESGKMVVKIYKYKEAEGVLQKNGAKIISEKMYQEIVSSKK
jgi:hypothetical protein